MRAALATFAAFVGAGAVPLVPFVLGWGDAFAQATAMTLAVFFTIGAAKRVWFEANWWRSGIETLAIGGGGAMVGYGVGGVFGA